MALALRSLPGRYAVARLGPDAALPAWFDGPGFCALARAEDELTLLCLEDRVPEGVEAQRGWFGFRSVGPFPFDASGILAALIGPVSAAGIGVFVTCTFDGEHIFVPAPDWPRARALLEDAGHRFEA